MSVAPTQANSGVGRVIDATPSVSIEYLLQITSSRMSDMDTDVKRRLTIQRSKGELTSALGNALSEVKGWAKDMHNWKTPDGADNVEGKRLCGINMYHKLDLAEKAAFAAQDMAAVAALQKQKAIIANAFGIQVKKDGVTLEPDANGKAQFTGKTTGISDEQHAALESALDGAMKTSSSSSELEMIDIQQIMSKRAQLLQMTTNMINSFNESTKGIVGNIR
jgi:hypothetical protein